MGRGILIATAACVIVALVAMATAAGGQSTHTYPVAIKISVDRPAKKIRGEVVSPAPAQFCEQSRVKIRQVMRGKDRVVARVRPNDISQWSMRVRRRLKGKRLYAQTSKYRLPQRPVVCLPARSRAVRAP